MSESLRVERVHPGATEELARLFERSDCPCYCQYWQFSGDHRDWQNRCANDRAASRAALADDVARGGLHGLVVWSGERVVGWVRVERPAVLKKSYEGRYYRGLPCFEGDRTGVWTVACFLVDPAERRRGVARALLDGAIELGRSLGARALEALPRGARDVSDEEQWTGPVDIYEQAGFEKVHDFVAYPVFRLSLSLA